MPDDKSKYNVSLIILFHQIGIPEIGMLIIHTYNIYKDITPP